MEGRPALAACSEPRRDTSRRARRRPLIKVNISSLTGTHSLNLAEQLESRGLLAKFYTALPRHRVPRLRPEHVATYPAVLFPYFVFRKLGLARRERVFDWAMTEAFDRWLTRALEPCDVLQVLSSYGLRAMRRAKELGAFTICDHGSAHIRTQDRLLREEYEKCGLPFAGVDHRFIEKEETEYQEADLVVVPSTFARDSFVAAGVRPDKVAMVPYGVELDDYSPLPKHDDVFRVLCVASLSPRKGLHYLFDAMRSLALPNSELLLRGAEAAESDQYLTKYKGQFKFVPPLAKARMRELFAQASVLVLPSIEDGFGLVIGQAMACGVPVIATTHTGGPDIISDGIDGFVVAPYSAAAIAERIEYLYRHADARDQMGQAALRKVRALNGWSQYADQIVGLYESRLALQRVS